MKHYIGIDLGTTNSAICSFDGENIRIYKSPDQNDVTPSAIFIDRRNNKYLGKRAYDNAAKNPDNAAIKFKRMMGTSTPIKLPAVDLVLTPEECSAEILRLLFGYLPEEIRQDSEIGTVITIPAAFNQMQRDSTMTAAEKAGIGKVALMQEPVAAVMSVMQSRKSDGTFLVYDLGGGTLDIAIAQSIAGRVSLLAHGGISMCGGTDFDRAILDNVVKPWLLENFNLPEDYSIDPKYKSLNRLGLWAAEKAKIELSAKDEAIITLSESELGIRDAAGEEIYLDITFKRGTLDELIEDKVIDSIKAARETLEKAGMGPNDVERIVFVGGPTHYKPLRDRVAFELGIEGSTEVNPMTAVAEGAAVFAESIDWNSDDRVRKNTRGAIKADEKLNVAFNYIARTPAPKAKIVAKVGGSEAKETEFQIDSLDTGWSSGWVALKDGAAVEVNLSKQGDNTFKVFIRDGSGPRTLENNLIVITRTAASVEGIPSSSSIGIEIMDKGRPQLFYLIKEGEPLPKKGSESFKAGISLRAGATTDPLRFKLWEGEIQDIPSDNRFIGELLIKGADFDEGIISQGAELVCEYEILDSGQIVLEVSVPSVSGSFRSGNFYSRQEGGINYADAANQVLSDAEMMRTRLNSVAEKVDDDRLDDAMKKLDQASSIHPEESDPETAKQAMENVLEAKRLLAKVRMDNRKIIRQLDLDKVVSFFDKYARSFARSTEVSKFDNLARTAERALNSSGNDFENYVDEMRGINFSVIWRRDDFVLERFKWLSKDVFLFPDKAQHEELVKIGTQAIKADDMDKLRAVVAQMDGIRVGVGSDDDMLSIVNITKG